MSQAGYWTDGSCSKLVPAQVILIDPVMPMGMESFEALIPRASKLSILFGHPSRAISHCRGEATRT